MSSLFFAASLSAAVGDADEDDAAADFEEDEELPPPNHERNPPPPPPLPPLSLPLPPATKLAATSCTPLISAEARPHVLAHSSTTFSNRLPPAPSSPVPPAASAASAAASHAASSTRSCTFSSPAFILTAAETASSRCPFSAKASAMNRRPTVLAGGGRGGREGREG